MHRAANRHRRGSLRLASSLLRVGKSSVAKRLPPATTLFMYTFTLAGIYYLLLLPAALTDSRNHTSFYTIGEAFEHMTRLFGSDGLAASVTMVLNGVIYLFYIQHLRPSSQPKALWSLIVHILDSAVEYPLFLTFHPTILAQRSEKSNLPSNQQLLLQVFFFFAIEFAFQGCILRFIHINPESPKTNGKSSVLLENTKRELSDDAENAVFDFLRPRGALLLGIALLGTSSTLTEYTGTLSHMAVVLWVSTGQLVDFRSYKKSPEISSSCGG
ncbi:hypothetical protein BDR22DRAFT_837778 [Usnea florida]